MQGEYNLEMLALLCQQVDLIASTAGPICGPAKEHLEIAWWHFEDLYRTLTGGWCSYASLQGSHAEDCGCCAQYKSLEPKARRRPITKDSIAQPSGPV